MVDDELFQHELDAEIGRLLADQTRQVVWSRYHLIGDALRREIGPVVDQRLVQSIHARLEQEPVVLAPNAVKRSAPRWFKPAAGFAVAASVAAVAVTLAPQFISPQQRMEQPLPSIAVRPVQTDQYLYVADNGTKWEMLGKPKVESRLNNYLVNHQGYAPANNLKGITPYATFVSYDSGK